MAPFRLLITLAFLAPTFLLQTAAHGYHGGEDQTPLVAPSADWATRHMAEEHHIANFDAASFFHLHDFDGSRTWDPSEIRRTYGLEDESNAHLSEEQRTEVVRKVLRLFDISVVGHVKFQDWMEAVRAGRVLPDFGYGPGHHGDDEYEYEIHHYEKFHGPDTRDEDLNHPEDIAHFRKHDAEEDEAEKQAMLDRMSIVEANIPQKFRRVA